MNSLQFSLTFSISHCQLEKFQMTGGSLTYSRYTKKVLKTVQKTTVPYLSQLL